MQTKKKAAENVFKSATTATEEVMTANVGSTEPCSSLPKTTSVSRAANSSLLAKCQTAAVSRKKTVQFNHFTTHGIFAELT